MQWKMTEELKALTSTKNTEAFDCWAKDSARYQEERQKKKETKNRK